MSLWIVYTKHLGKNHSPVDWDPNTYSNVAVFDDELDALRYANSVGAKCAPYTLSQTLDHVASQ